MAVFVSPLPSLEMEVTFAIDDEDEELTFEGFLDKKMEGVELGQAESVYTLACSCLQDRKNQRPVSKQVRRGKNRHAKKSFLHCFHSKFVGSALLQF